MTLALTLLLTSRTDVSASDTRATLELVIGDLTAERTDAIVNPSSTTLSGGGLVDLAVRRVGGVELVSACRAAIGTVPGGQLTPGRVVLTRGFGLPARHVIHCVPPVYADGSSLAREQLADCHRGALRLARAHGLSSISFPAIATGIYGFPVREAAEVALDALATELRAHHAPSLVRLVLVGPGTLEAYLDAARSRLSEHSEHVVVR
jgi:O-acetyl-ADP-ribose deacetylase (regulator of RNase III)